MWVVDRESGFVVMFPPSTTPERHEVTKFGRGDAVVTALAGCKRALSYLRGHRKSRPSRSRPRLAQRLLPPANSNPCAGHRWLRNGPRGAP